jgi:hypothetical protein
LFNIVFIKPHGAESVLRSWYILRYSRNSQDLATYPYPEPYQSNPCFSIQPLKDLF